MLFIRIEEQTSSDIAWPSISSVLVLALGSGVMLLWPDYTHASTQHDECGLNIKLLPLVKLCETLVLQGHFMARCTYLCHIVTPWSSKYIEMK